MLLTNRFQLRIKCPLLEQELPEQHFSSLCVFLLLQNQNATHKQRPLALACVFVALVLA